MPNTFVPIEKEKFISLLKENRAVTKSKFIAVGNKNITLDAVASSITIGEDEDVYPVYGIHGVDTTPSEETIFLNKKADNWLRSACGVGGDKDPKGSARRMLRKMKEKKQKKEEKRKGKKARQRAARKKKKKEEEGESESEDFDYLSLEDRKPVKSRKRIVKSVKKRGAKEERKRKAKTGKSKVEGVFGALTPFESLESPAKADDVSLSGLKIKQNLSFPTWKYSRMLELTSVPLSDFGDWFDEAWSHLKDKYGRECIVAVGRKIRELDDSWTSARLNDVINATQADIEKSFGSGSFPYAAICAAFLSTFSNATVLAPLTGKGSIKYASEIAGKRKKASEEARAFTAKTTKDDSDDEEEEEEEEVEEDDSSEEDSLSSESSDDSDLSDDSDSSDSSESSSLLSDESSLF